MRRPHPRQQRRDGSLICHLDRDTPYVAILHSERPAYSGVEPSANSKGTSHDNALTKTSKGLHKAELICRRALWKTREGAAEFAPSHGDPGSTSNHKKIRFTNEADLSAETLTGFR